MTDIDILCQFSGVSHVSVRMNNEYTDCDVFLSTFNNRLDLFEQLDQYQKTKGLSPLILHQRETIIIGNKDLFLKIVSICTSPFIFCSGMMFFVGNDDSKSLFPELVLATL